MFIKVILDNLYKNMDKSKSIITQKDLLILRKLLEDGRKSSASISKEIDLGREIVNYRIKRLIKENLIVKFVPKINEKAMHYQEYIILLKLNLDDELSKEKFIRETIGNKYLIWTVKSQSGWDLIVRLYSQSIDEFKIKLSEILENFSDVLASYYTIINSEEIKQNEKQILSKNLFEENLTNKDFNIIKNETIIQTDEKDKEILDILEQDARIQYKEIADKLNISSDTVKYRIDKMKEAGIIENFMPVINFNKLGLYSFAAILKLSYLTKQQESEVNEFISSLDCVARAIKNLNSEEFFLNLIFSKKDEIENFKDKINSKFSNKIENFEIFDID